MKTQRISILVFALLLFAGCDQQVSQFIGSSFRPSSDGIKNSYELSINYSNSLTAAFNSMQTVTFTLSTTSESNLTGLAFQSLPSGWSLNSNNCTSLAVGQTCTIVLNHKLKYGTQNYSLTLSYLDPDGAQMKNLSFQAIPTLPGLATIEKVYPIHGVNWNDYVSRTELTKDENSQTEAACSPSVSSTYVNCIHGGEKLKVLTGMTSCMGLSITDSLSAFQWTCNVVNGEAIFFSNQLKLGKGLKDLVNSTSWKPISVTVLSGVTNLLVSTATSTLWNNTVMALPDTSVAPATLSTAGVIYTYNAPMSSRGWTISASKVAVVGLTTDAITYVAGTGVFKVSVANYNWFEVRVTGGIGIYVMSGAARYMRVLNSSFSNTVNGISSDGAMGALHASTIVNTVIAKTSNYGISFTPGFGGNLLWKVAINNANGFCIEAILSGKTKLIQVYCLNSSFGIHLKYGGSVVACSIININDIGLNQDYLEAGGYLNNVLIANTLVGIKTGHGMFYDHPQLFSNLAMIGNSNYDIDSLFALGSTKKDKLTNTFLTTTPKCFLFSPAQSDLTGFVNSTCTTTGTNGSSTYSAGAVSDAVLRTGA